jgi:hypothetical protein
VFRGIVRGLLQLDDPPQYAHQVSGWNAAIYADTADEAEFRDECINNPAYAMYITDTAYDMT